MQGKESIMYRTRRKHKKSTAKTQREPHDKRFNGKLDQSVGDMWNGKNERTGAQLMTTQITVLPGTPEGMRSSAAAPRAFSCGSAPAAADAGPRRTAAAAARTASRARRRSRTGWQDIGQAFPIGAGIKHYRRYQQSDSEQAHLHRRLATHLLDVVQHLVIRKRTERPLSTAREDLPQRHSERPNIAVRREFALERGNAFSSPAFWRNT